MGNGTERTTRWLPVSLFHQERELVKEVAQKIDFDLDYAQAFCVALLEEVNLHQEAAAVNELLVSFLTP